MWKCRKVKESVQEIDGDPSRAGVPIGSGRSLGKYRLGVRMEIILLLGLFHGLWASIRLMGVNIDTV